MYPISLFKYSNINSKLKGMYSKKLKEKDFEELMNQKDLKSAIFILKIKNAELTGISDDSKRIKIETALDKIIIADIIKIYRLLDKKDKKIFMQFIEKYKLKCIKSVFRKIFSQNILHDNTENINTWTTSIFKDINGIQEVKDIKQFLEVIKKTPYIKAFELLQESDENKAKLFKIENEIDKVYLNNLLNTVKKENSRLEKMIIKKIDLTNILWIYRIKKYYNFSDNELRSIIIPKDKRAKGLDIEHFINAQSDIEILEKLKKLNLINYAQMSTGIEQDINRIWYKINKRIFRDKIFDISSICAYINLIELENMNIVRIIEGIRYEISKEEIQKKLVII